jgi:riboflavin kinase/FMN adenylyltransferase
MIIVSDPDFSFENTCVTVGKFDALHIGHKALMERMDAYRAMGMKTAVLRLEMAGGESVQTQGRFFCLNDSQREETSPCLNESSIRTERERTELLEALGIDIYIRLPFTDELAHMSAEDFVKDILVRKLGVKAMVIGDDFRFGFERKGDAELLKKLGAEYGFETAVLDRIRCDGQVVSSSLIRKLIREKRLEEAYKMLG